MPSDQRYQRHLPHRIPAGVPIFLTWNLKGAFPRDADALLQAEEKRLEISPKRKGETDRERQVRLAKILFAMRDGILGDDCAAYLQECRDGGDGVCVRLESLTYGERPMWLADRAAACEVAKSFLWGVGERYQLLAFVVMGNHVHGLLKPQVDLEIITQGIKGFTAHQINQLQNARGRVFWQDESYDRWPRDETEFFRIIHYIEQNPVVARLCGTPDDWIWSSAAVRQKWQWPIGEPFPVEKKQEVTTWFEQQV